MKKISKVRDKSRNILITGGAGFIASNFIHYWINKYPSDNLIIFANPILDKIRFKIIIVSIFIPSFFFIKKNIN